jgi:hypothetical protein
MQVSMKHNSLYRIGNSRNKNRPFEYNSKRSIHFQKHVISRYLNTATRLRFEPRTYRIQASAASIITINSVTARLLRGQRTSQLQYLPPWARLITGQTEHKCLQKHEISPVGRLTLHTTINGTYEMSFKNSTGTFDKSHHCWLFLQMTLPLIIASHKSNPASLTRVTWRSVPWVTWEAVTGVEEIPCRGLLRHTLAKGALVFPHQGGRNRAKGCMALGW